MTDAAIAAMAVTARQIEADARRQWDATAAVQDAEEYAMAMAATRQAGALRRALEQWIVARATKGPVGAAGTRP